MERSYVPVCLAMHWSVVSSSGFSFNHIGTTFHTTFGALWFFFNSAGKPRELAIGSLDLYLSDQYYLDLHPSSLHRNCFKLILKHFRIWRRHFTILVSSPIWANYIPVWRVCHVIANQNTEKNMATKIFRFDQWIGWTMLYQEIWWNRESRRFDQVKPLRCKF